jgi:hypothetical protein
MIGDDSGGGDKKGEMVVDIIMVLYMWLKFSFVITLKIAYTKLHCYVY